MSDQARSSIPSSAIPLHCVLGILVVFGITACVPSEPRPDPNRCLPSVLRPASEAPREVAAAAVYLDLSSSMFGFLGDSGQVVRVTPLQRLLRSWIREGLGEAGINELRWEGFGREVVAIPSELADYSPQRAPNPRDFFREEETNLVSAFRAAASRPDELSLVISDNAQDLLYRDGGVALGFDRGAFVRSIADGLMAEGFGVWLIGVKSDFNGIYFSVQLAAESRAVVVNRAIQLRGRQPLYLWIASRDFDKGRNLTKYLVSQLEATVSLEAEPVQESGILVAAIELAPGQRPQARPDVPSASELEARRQVLREQQASLMPGAAPRSGLLLRDYLDLREWVPNPAQSSTFALVSPPSAETRELIFLLHSRLDWSGATSSWDSAPRQVWSLVIPKPSGLEAVIDRPPAAPGSTFAKQPDHFVHEVNLAQEYLLTRHPSSWRLELPILTQATTSAIPEDYWLRAWSTNDDATEESIRGRTLYLWDVTQPLLERSIGQAEQVWCVDLAIVRR